jgi:5-methyltetrahydropteroyltriglutamate--homocysteine methyltransferase
MSIELRNFPVAQSCAAPMALPRGRPPFRADHVGSLLRPQRLLEARELRQAGRISAEEFKAVEDDSVLEIIRLQQNCGLEGITDGELRRNSWHMDFLYRIGGVEKVQNNLKVRFHNHGGDIEFTPSALRVTGKLRLEEPIFLEDFEFLKANATGAPKLTIPSPSMLHYRGGNHSVDPGAYADIDAFWRDLSGAYAAELDILYRHGCRYLQFDDTSLAYLNDPAQRAHVKDLGGDPDNQHLVYIKAFNAAVAGRPEDMAVCTHLCRGNYKSSWVASGGYDHVADDLFNRMDVDGFFLEYDDARSGGFEPLRFVPRGKTVVLGLISSKHGGLEEKDDIKRRLDEASRFIDLDQVCISPQCGFASTCDGNDITIDEQAAKLRLAVDVAYDVWGGL